MNGLLSSLDISNVKTAWSLALLVLTSLAFVAWLALGPRRLMLGQGLFVGLLAVDLLVFAFDFHPRAPLASLSPPVADCNAHGGLTRHYTVKQLQKALATMPADIKQYTSCPDVIDHQLLVQLGKLPGSGTLW